MLTTLLRDEDYREELAKASYFRERQEEAARDAEQDLEATEYLCLDWDSLEDWAKRPYRTAVAVTCDEIARVAAA